MYNDVKEELGFSPLKFIIGVIVFLFGITILWGSWYQTDQGQLGIVLRNGKIVDVAEPGLHLKAPWLDSVSTFSVRTEKLLWQKVPSYSKDIQRADFDVSVNFRVDPKKVKDIYSEYGMNFAERILYPQVPSAIKDVAGQYTASELISKRPELSTRIQDRLIARLPADIIIDSIQIENIDFSEEYERAIEAAAEMQAQAQKAQQQLAREEAQAKIKIVQAEAEAAAITAQGEAEASAIKAKGEALRQSPELVQLTIAQQWNGVLPVNMYAGAPLPLLNIAK